MYFYSFFDNIASLSAMFVDVASIVTARYLGAKARVGAAIVYRSAVEEIVTF